MEQLPHVSFVSGGTMPSRPVGTTFLGRAGFRSAALSGVGPGRRGRFRLRWRFDVPSFAGMLQQVRSAVVWLVIGVLLLAGQPRGKSSCAVGRAERPCCCCCVAGDVDACCSGAEPSQCSCGQAEERPGEPPGLPVEELRFACVELERLPTPMPEWTEMPRPAEVPGWGFRPHRGVPLYLEFGVFLI